jgi:hypothetical protein
VRLINIYVVYEPIIQSVRNNGVTSFWSFFNMFLISFPTICYHERCSITSLLTQLLRIPPPFKRRIGRRHILKKWIQKSPNLFANPLVGFFSHLKLLNPWINWVRNCATIFLSLCDLRQYWIQRSSCNWFSYEWLSKSHRESYQKPSNPGEPRTL